MCITVSSTHVNHKTRRCGPAWISEMGETTQHAESTGRKKCCQVINSVPWFVALCCVLNFLEGFIVNGVTNINIPSFELQYQLPSTKSALIASATNIGGLACVLFVSYAGSGVHKPVFTGLGALVMAVGSLVFLIPHWTGDNYQYPPKSSPDVYCDGDRNQTNTTAPPTSDSPFLGVFMLGNALHGAGYTPLYTLAVAYMDENESPQKAGFYVGLFYASAAVGVAVGFLSGGQFLQYYVDFDRVDMASIDIQPTDFGYWVGAWWLGYIVSAVGFALFALPLFGYPKHMTGFWASRHEGEAKQTDKTETKCLTAPVGFCVAFIKLMKNPVFILLTLAASCVGMIINGISSFSAKYLFEQFGLPFDTIGYLLGGLILVGSGGGMALGGLLVRVLRLEIRGMARLCLFCILIGSLSGIALLAKCPEVQFAGLDLNSSNNNSSPGILTSPCNARCECAGIPYTPVCGEDRQVYYSPCHAGCTHAQPPARLSNCSCIGMSSVADDSDVTNDTDGLGSVNFGRCADGCDMFYILGPFLLIMFLAVFVITTPVSMATLRCVDDNLRPFALGVQWAAMRLLGFIPGPVLIGFVLDRSCGLWSGDGDTGVCLLYRRADMALYLTIWWIAVTVIAILLFSVVLCLAERKVSKRNFVTKSSGPRDNAD